VDLIYLDYNCFQRPFDNLSDTRIRIEALACQEIFARAEAQTVELVWSFVHVDETVLCPFPDRQAEAFRLSSLCRKRQGPTGAILQTARKFSARQNLSGRDALHVAAAIETGAGIFLSCDDRLIHRALRMELDIELLNPVDYIRRKET
jgi:predicted nucleic acid-binding protein